MISEKMWGKGDSLLWKKNKPPVDPTQYNVSPFTIMLKEKLSPTDSRLRQRQYLENGVYDNANAEKLWLEQRLRLSKSMQEDGWKPRWFKKDGKEGTHRYIGAYWKASDQNNWLL